MLQKSFYLIYISWRKFFVKGDFFSLGILLAVYTFSIVGIYQTYEKKYYFLFLFLLFPVSHHLGRSDFSLLQNFPKWRKLIFLEYLLHTLPILLFFSIKQDFLYAFISFLVPAILVFLPQKSLKINYPFAVSDPFWIISFRKYKLIFLFPILVFLLIMAKIYQNENLALFVFILTAILGIIPYFEREFLAHIFASKFKGEKYLEKQIICGMKNFSILFFPIFTLILMLFHWKIALLGLFCFLFVLLSVLTKYVFFENPLVQSIVFIMILGGYSFGLPIICLPFLYYKAVKKLKNVTN